jgi:hypothetical protein
MWHSPVMPYRPRKSKKTNAKPGTWEDIQSRAAQFSDHRRRETNTRSTLSRLRNRKSDLK